MLAIVSAIPGNRIRLRMADGYLPTVSAIFGVSDDIKRISDDIIWYIMHQASSTSKI